MSAKGVGWKGERFAGLVQSFISMAAFKTREERVLESSCLNLPGLQKRKPF